MHIASLCSRCLRVYPLAFSATRPWYHALAYDWNIIWKHTQRTRHSKPSTYNAGRSKSCCYAYPSTKIKYWRIIGWKFVIKVRGSFKAFSTILIPRIHSGDITADRESNFDPQSSNTDSMLPRFCCTSRLNSNINQHSRSRHLFYQAEEGMIFLLSYS